MNGQLSAVWVQALKRLKESVSDSAYEHWVESLKPLGIHENKLYLKAPSEVHYEVVTGMLADDITTAVNFNRTEPLTVELLKHDQDTPECLRFSVNYENREDNALTLNPAYTFSSFVVGESNRFAHAVALSVSEHPHGKFNPLFLYGGSGLGKTHLVHAIGNKIKEKKPDYTVLYITSEDFMNEFISTIVNENNTVDFRNKYRSCDVLIIDDIQFIAKADRTQIEFFHTFNALYESNKQIIITSDRPPKEMTELEERMRTRFERGLIADIKAPDFETRVAILRKKAQEENFEISENILYYIAEKLKSNIRILEGVLKRLMAYNVLMGKKITKDLADEAINEFLKTTDDPHVNTEYILSVVANYFNIKPDEILSSKRTKNVSHARQISMYLIREMTDFSLTKIGEELGGRDHTTIMSGIRKISESIQNDADTKKVVDEIMNNLENREQS